MTSPYDPATTGAVVPGVPGNPTGASPMGPFAPYGTAVESPLFDFTPSRAYGGLPRSVGPWNEMGGYYGGNPYTTPPPGSPYTDPSFTRGLQPVGGGGGGSPGGGGPISGPIAPGPSGPSYDPNDPTPIYPPDTPLEFSPNPTLVSPAGSSTGSQPSSTSDMYPPESSVNRYPDRSGKGDPRYTEYLSWFRQNGQKGTFPDYLAYLARKSGGPAPLSFGQPTPVTGTGGGGAMQPPIGDPTPIFSDPYEDTWKMP